MYMHFFYLYSNIQNVRQIRYLVINIARWEVTGQRGVLEESKANSQKETVVKEGVISMSLA